ncbi:MAG: hypothetical protein GF398_05045 [Chitinivibrionales bacterium]|nr:hypothetical protein [Chitinivibrionales bacterium]
MMFFKQVPCFVILMCALSFMLIQCGVSEKQLNEAETRIQALKQKGADPDLVAKAEVHLYQAKSGMKMGNISIAGKNADSLFIVLDQAEQQYAATMEKIAPEIEALQKSFDEKKAQVSGMQLKVVDSMMVIIDSLKAKNWLVQAKRQMDRLDSMFVQLLKDEENVNKLKPKLPGSWRRVEQEGKSIRNTYLTLKKDNTLKMIEEQKGQIDERTRVDWKFVSDGTYDMRGDTLWLFVKQEKCPRQTYWNYKKGKWVKFEAPTYDSTYTGQKDQFMSWEYFSESFRRM